MKRKFLLFSILFLELFVVESFFIDREPIEVKEILQDGTNYSYEGSSKFSLRRFPDETAIRVVRDEQVRHWTPREDWANYIIAVSDSLKIDPMRIVRIAYVESRWTPYAVNRGSGATGLMQVMPRYWTGIFPQCGDNLKDAFTNLCYGMNIYAFHLEDAKGNVTLALNSYWGCDKLCPEGAHEPSWYSVQTF